MKGYILVLVACVAFAGAAAAQQQPTMEEVVKKWDAKKRIAKYVVYTIEESCTILQDRVQQIANANSKRVIESGRPPSFKLESTHTLSFDFESGSFRWDTDGQEWGLTEKRIVPLRGARVFADGVFKSVRYPNSGQTGVGVEAARASDFAELRGDLQGQAFPKYFWPLFWEHGIVPMIVSHQLYPGQWHKYSSLEFADVGTLTSPTTINLAPVKDNQNQIGGSLTLVDSLDCKIRTISIFRNSKPVETIEAFREKRSIGEQLSWKYKKLNQLGDTIIDSKFTVISSSFGVSAPSDAFELLPKPGMIFRKVHIPTATQQGDSLPIAHAFQVEADETLTPLPKAKETPSSWRIAVSYTSLLLVLLTGVWIARSKRSWYAKSRK